MEYRSPRDLVADAAAMHGDRPAVVSSDERLTYRALAARTAAVAAILRKAGVGAGDQVALAFPNSIAFLIWYFGVLEAGGVVVPISPALSAAAAADIMNTARIGFLAAPGDTAFPGELGMKPVPDAGEPERGSILWRGPQAFPAIETRPWTPEGIIIRQFSSGSTGRPKHMFRTEWSYFHSYWQYCETLGLGADERVLGVAPFHHSSGAGSFQAAIYLGAMLIVLPRFLPGPVINAALRHRPTVFRATPPMIEVLGACRIEDGDEKAFDSLAHCSCGAGRLTKTVIDGFFGRYGVRARNRYGSNETGTATIDLDDDYQDGRVGRPYVGIEIDIIDDDGDPCPTGITGRIGVRSPSACEGYVDDPELSAKVFREDGFVFPGDLGYLDQSGRLFVLGRSDVINIGGYKVDPLEVENLIRGVDAVRDVAVFGGERAGLPVVKAVIEADPDVVGRSMIVALCRARLQSYKVPSLIEIHRSLERDGNGKILRETYGG